MAYISAEETRNIKRALKARFPRFRFSVKNDGKIAVVVSILSGPSNFGIESDNAMINQNYLSNYKDQEILEEMVKIINTSGGVRENFDKSDSMTDYFYVGYYVSLNLGSWSKPFQLTA